MILKKMCLMCMVLSPNAPINVKPLGGEAGHGWGFDSSHRPVVGTFDPY